MKPDDISAKIRAKVDEIRRYRTDDLPHVVGTEAVNHFKASFANEGFTDKNTVKWQNVKRRDPASPWYGFSMENKKRFSNTRALDKILTGDSKELQNSISYIRQADRVTVYSDKEYAAVHQYGLTSKIFGKKSFVMPRRPFIGRSEVLERSIYAKIERDLNSIINKQ